MKTFEIRLDEKIGERWQNVNPKIRERAEKSFIKQIEAILKKTSESDFDTILKEIREEAAKNGLTPEILQEILNEEQ